jgi:ParB-like chromosome segregation protein Spo0J
MKDYTVIAVDPDLLPQVLRELFAIATNPDLVEVNESDYGRVIHAHPEVAEAWYQQAVANGSTPSEEVAEVVAESKEVLATASKAEDAPEEVVAESKKVLATATTAQNSVPEPEPVKRGPGRPRKEASPTSASNGEEP